MPSKKAILALIIANTIWGAGSPIFKWAFENSTLDPYTLSFFRFIIAAILIFIFEKGKIKINFKDFPKIFLVGFLAIFINIVFFLVGIIKTFSINAPLIGSAGPIFLIFGAILFLNERPAKRVLIGNLLGLIGILIIVIQPLIMKTNGGSFLGNLLLVISMFGAVSGAIIAKELLKKYSAITLSFWSFLVGSLCILPIFLSGLTMSKLTSQFSLVSLTAILFGAFASSTLAYYLYYFGLKKIPASQTSIFLYVDPLAAVLVAMPLIHEIPSLLFILGSLLVFLGIFIAEKRIHYHPIHLLAKK